LKGGAAGELPERATKLVSIAHSNSERLVRLINDILDIEKIESGKLAFEMQPVRLRQLLAQAIEANRGFAEQYGVKLEIEFATENAIVSADPDRLMQVLTNLISNAVKFSPGGGAVSTSILRKGDQYRISVADRGSGIPEEFRGRIFSKFAQADASATREKGGTGLGLSIVREIVTRLGGTVAYEDRPGGGTVFHVDLPAAEEESGIFSTNSGVAGQPILLHIDDDPDVLRVVASAFEDRAFVTSVNSLDAARDALSGCGFDLIILDIALGDGSGLELLPQIHNLPCRAPVVLFTAQDTDPELASQADAVLTKSRATLDQLVETVDALLQRRDQAS
jgi:CheY-like chemotaxis protein/anti-sigma regulatory factor (Ser/Thr protein kinase)